MLSLIGLKTITNNYQSYSRGEKRNIIEVNKINFSVRLLPLICYEIIFPEEINPNNEKLDLIVNITNDAWFGNSSGPFQHFNSSRFRAIEQGVPVFRSANTGISAIIDPYGRIIDKIGLGKKGSIFSPLPKKTVETYYSKVGDLLFFGVLILTLLIMIFLKKKKKYGRSIKELFFYI